MLQCYGKRNPIASGFVAPITTTFGLAHQRYAAITAAMFDREAFLAAVLQKAGTKAAIARALDLPTSRIAELYRGDRKLTMEEGMKLSEAFGVAPTERVSAERLLPVLRVCLRYAPQGGWTEQSLERLAQEIEYGLALLQTVAPSSPSQDAIQVAERAISGRFRDKPA